MSYVRIAHSLTLGIEVRASCAECGAAAYSTSEEQGGVIVVRVRLRCACGAGEINGASIHREGVRS